MCPYFKPSKYQSLCTSYPRGLYCPSLQRISSYCSSQYTNCPYFGMNPDPALDSVEKDREPVGPLEAA